METRGNGGKVREPMKDPGYIGSDLNVQAEIERAHRIGTYDKIDRTPQYEGPDRARPGALLKSQNELWNKTRKVEDSHNKLWDKTVNVESQQVRLDREVQFNQAKVDRDMKAISKRAN